MTNNKLKLFIMFFIATLDPIATIVVAPLIVWIVLKALRTECE